MIKKLILLALFISFMQGAHAVQFNAGISVDYVKDINESLIYVSPDAVREVPKLNYADLAFFVKYKPQNMLSVSEIVLQSQIRKAAIVNNNFKAPGIYNISMKNGGAVAVDEPQNIEDLIQQNPNRPEYLYAMAIKLANEKKHDEAIAQINKALKINNNYALGHFLKADILRTLGFYKDAAREYFATVKINPYCTDAYFNIAKMLETIGNIDLALNYYQMAQMVNPNDLEIRNQILKLNKRQQMPKVSLK